MSRRLIAPLFTLVLLLALAAPTFAQEATTEAIPAAEATTEAANPAADAVNEMLAQAESTAEAAEPTAEATVEAAPTAEPTPAASAGEGTANGSNIAASGVTAGFLLLGILAVLAVGGMTLVNANRPRSK